MVISIGRLSDYYCSCMLSSRLVITAAAAVSLYHSDFMDVAVDCCELQDQPNIHKPIHTFMQCSKFWRSLIIQEERLLPEEVPDGVRLRPPLRRHHRLLLRHLRQGQAEQEERAAAQQQQQQRQRAAAAAATRRSVREAKIF